MRKWYWDVRAGNWVTQTELRAVGEAKLFIPGAASHSFWHWATMIVDRLAMLAYLTFQKQKHNAYSNSQYTEHVLQVKLYIRNHMFMRLSGKCGVKQNHIHVFVTVVIYTFGYLCFSGGK